MRRLLPAILVAALPAEGARPLATEDASYLEDKACQVEAWMNRSSVETQAWMAPACNFGLGIEWQLGFSRSHSDGTSRFAESYFQAKTAWRSIDDDSWAVGAVLGVTKKPQEPAAPGWENPYVLVPFSWRAGAATTFHVNIGWGRERAEHRDATLWGIAVERNFTPRLALLAESFGDDRGNPFFRVGGRYTAITNRLDLDLSLVTRSGGERADRLISLGLHAQTDRFLP